MAFASEHVIEVKRVKDFFASTKKEEEGGKS
jgi:hypothetical protein